MKIRAPAKINLGFRVVGKRADGYHLVDTIMVAVTLYDEIEIKSRRPVKAKGGQAAQLRVTCDHPLVPAGKKNLVYRAVSRLLEEAGAEQRLAIHIRKRIPVGAGLGGGSTDAAAALVGVNHLYKFNFSIPRLEKLAASLGADVPFFIQARPARARGIGDRLTYLKGIPPWWLVILYPGFPLSTAWVYKHLYHNLTKSRAKTSMTALLRSTPKVADLLVNDLEAGAAKRYRGLGRLKHRLIELGAQGASMTGSGSAVYGIFGSREKAGEAYRRLRRTDDTQAFLAQVISRPRQLPDRRGKGLKEGGPYGSN